MSDGLFGRTWSLRVGLPGEDDLEWLPPAGLRFEVLLTSKRSANKATISLINVDPASLGQLDQDGAIVTLRAGYEALDGQIFSGSIAKRGVTTERSDQPRRATTTTNDGGTYVTIIEAGEGEIALQETRIVKSLARGVSNRIIFGQIADDLGISLYDESLIEELSYSGGWVYQGRASGALDGLVRDIGAKWSIQAGQLLVLRADQTTPEDAYVISPESGLVGVPSATKDGLELTSLLLAPLRPGRRIIVKSKTVNGIYRIDEVTHKGDYRGQEWHSVIKASVVKAGATVGSAASGSPTLKDSAVPTMGELIHTGSERVVEEVSVSYPYEVVSQDTDTGLVSLDPLVRIRGDDGVITDLPQLTEVPVGYPAGGGYHIVFPLVPGDAGFILVASRSISQWVESGDAKADPEGRRVSSLTDAIFYPGVRPRTNPHAELAGGVFSVGSDDGDLEVVVIGDPVRIGSATASNPLAKSVPVTSDLTKIATDLQSIKASLASHGIGTVITFTAPADNATSKLKAE